MKNKVILISIDGMRPDGFLQCNNPYVQELMKISSYSLNAKSIEPSVTLPCHMSMFHSVPPIRHGITTNLYLPPVRPINGIFEQVSQSGGKCAMFYGWEPLCDVRRPGSLIHSCYINAYSDDFTDTILTDRAIEYVQKYSPDFVFLYMVETDEKGGHDNGWMSKPYLDCVNRAIENAKRVIEKFGNEYSVIITADHGGHDRGHGTTLPEDMTIPMFFYGKDFPAGKKLNEPSLLDIAPTIAKIMDIPIPREWEGKSIL